MNNKFKLELDFKFAKANFPKTTFQIISFNEEKDELILEVIEQKKDWKDRPFKAICEETWPLKQTIEEFAAGNYITISKT